MTKIFKNHIYKLSMTKLSMTTTLITIVSCLTVLLSVKNSNAIVSDKGKLKSVAELKVLPMVEISPKDNIYLGDIVILKGHTIEALQSIQNIIVRELTGHEENFINISRSELIEKIKNNSEIQKHNFKFTIPDQVRVTTSAKTISKFELERNIQNYLLASCNECDYEVKITQVPNVKDPSWKLNYETLPEKGSFIASLKTTGNSWISGVIRVKKNVVTPTRMLRMGDRILSSDLTREMIDVTYIKDTLAEESDLIGRVSARTINPKQAVLVSDVKREHLVKRGQVVSVVTGSNGFEITSQMVADENGFLGDVVRLKGADSKLLFSGVVEQAGTVRLQ